GHSEDVRLRLKGNLAEFPFADGKNGIFQVTAHATEGTLAYADGWPHIENIVADLNFKGRRMEITSREASIFGAHLTNVHVLMADLRNRDQPLEVSGEAEGPTAEFLTFVEKSPVNAMIDRFAEGVHAQGRGKLALKLSLPL